MNFFFKFFSLLLSVCLFFVGYPMSFMPSECDKIFNVQTGAFTEDQFICNGFNAVYELEGNGEFADGKITFVDKITLDTDELKVNYFNYFGIRYTSNAYLKGKIVYGRNNKEYAEEFFLEPDENGEFYSFIDGMLERKKANRVYSLSFEPLDADSAELAIKGFATFNREIPAREVYVSNGSIKIGVDLLWGGALSYYEDLDSAVESVNDDGVIKVDSNASQRYGKRAISKNVNLINRFDAGRLIQQSYYGTNGGNGDGYVQGEYMGNKWNYNPVQGGNQFNDSSKIVDLRVSENELYIKCRPLDWALPKEDITPSYMEATYQLDGKLLHANCRFVDFSGYTPYYTSQEIPAFYCIEPFNRFIYYGGDEPWSGGALTVEPELIFWPDAGYPKFNSLENWSAFIGEFDDSFGLGVYVPEETSFLAGVFDRENTHENDPSRDDSTSYIAVIKFRTFQSFDPYSYDFYITSGDSAEMRETFSTIS